MRRSNELIKFRNTLLAATIVAAPMAAHAADVDLWISDTSGNIGQVDVTTHTVVAGSVHNTGQALTDIGFNSAGTLFGTTFNNLFSINTGTGGATGIGGANGVGGMNALIGNGVNLLGAAFNTNTVYNISSTTGAVTNFKGVSLPSAGDLAFVGSALFESATNGAVDALLNVTTNTVIGNFHVGATDFSGVFGLADDGTTLYAVNGTEVYSVDASTAALTPIFDYSGHVLTTATGTAFINEAPPPPPVPEPASLGLLGAGLLGLGMIKLRKRQS